METLYRADHDGRQGNADVEGAQGEADGEVIDAQSHPRDQQPPCSPAHRCSWRLPVVTGWATKRLDHRIAAGGDQQRCADPVRGVAEGSSQAAPQQQAEDGHAGFEEAEDHPHAQPGTCVNPAHPDANSGGEVGQPKRDGHEHQGKHGTTVPTTGPLVSQ
jgi:hypothetical protein